MIQTKQKQGKKFIRILLLLILTLFFYSAEIKAQSELDTLGNFWSPISGTSNDDIKTISIDSSGFIYLSIWGKGLMRSTNQGSSWTDITNNLPELNISAIEFDSTGRIFLGTLGGGVFYSSNNGNSWVEKNNGLTNKRVTSLKIFRGGPMYVGTIGGGVFRSDNGGNNWVQKNNGLKFWHITAMILNNQGGVVVGTPNDGVWKSFDNGENWSRGNGSLSSRNITSFAKNSLGELVVGTLGGGVCLSIDGGGGWSIYYQNDICKDVSSVVFSDINEPVAGLTHDGIVRYDDRIWNDWRLTSMRSSGITALARSADNTLWAAIPLMGLYKSTNKGQNWEYVDFARTYSMVEVFGADDGWALATKKDTSLWVSSDYGVTWQDDFLPFHKITAFGLDSTGAWLVGARSAANSQSYLYRSTDKGQNWASLWSKADTTVVAIGVNTQGHIYCGLSFPPADPRDPNSIRSELYLSTNNGTNWFHLPAKSPTNGFEFVGINFNDDIYINQDNGLYKSTDNGVNWVRVLNDQTAVVSSIGFASNGDIHCGTDLGLFSSTNGGTNWTTNDFGLQYPGIKKLVVSPHNQIIVGLIYQSGFLCSDDGIGFYEINRGFIHSYLWSMSQSRDGFIYIATNTLYRGIEPESLTPPLPLNPPHDSEGIDRNGTFTWQAVPEADMYEFQISETPDFFIVDEKITIGATSHKLRYELDANKRYFWRLRSRTNASMSDWSQVMAFTSEIEKPLLVSPENHSGSLEITGLPFFWHPVPTASIYEIQLSSNPGFTTIIDSMTVNDDTTAILGKMALYTKYYWRVRGRTFKTVGPWSEVWDFNTKLKPPVLKAPPHGSTAMPNVVTLEWYLTEGADKYEVQLAKDSLFVDMVYEGLTENNTSQKTKILEYFTMYWWRIRGLNDEGNSDWSAPWNFTTVLTSPILVSPTTNSYDKNIDIMFDWRNDTNATNYHIQISTNAGFSDVIYQDSTIVPDSVFVENFDHFKTYYWRVRKYNNSVPGLWSETWSFSTGIGIVELINPQQGATNQSIDLNFVWELLNGADEYIFQISKQSDFSELTKQVETVETQTEILGLEYETKYYWRVKGKYDKGQGDWSETREFETQLGAGVDYEAMPGMVDFNVYPNPFAISLNLEFNLSYGSDVSIEITDVVGNHIYELHQGRLESGLHSFVFEPKDINQGTYLVILAINKQRSVKQVIFIK